MSRCEHLNAVATWYDGERITAQCPDCKRVWFGGIRPVVSHRGRVRKPPKWVKGLAKRIREILEET